ncbi:MAG: CHAT domain-containing protein [Crocosphaera sp.]
MSIKQAIKLIILSLFVTEIINSHSTLAQSILPANDGTGTIVEQKGNQFYIQGGSLSADEQNLFHSLEKFGLDVNQIANFLSHPQIRNILTRIVGGEPSLINGLISITGSNANLFLMNPNGIIFGPNVQLNLPADFTATTATGIGFNNNHWFNAFGENNYPLLMGDPSQFAFDLAQGGSIINTGNLSIQEGHNLTLIAENIINTGTINVPGGNLTIAAIPGTNRIRISQPGNLVSLEIIAPRQTNSQRLEIKPQDLPTLLTQGSQTLNLNITTNTTPGTIITSGSLNTVSPSQVGGNVTLVGDRIGMINGNIDASGNNGGGRIRIGGDYRGQDTIPTAQRTLIDSNSTLRSDGINQGNGGLITVFAEEITGFYGKISSQGGAFSGNGGLVEISAQQNLIFRGDVDTTAVNGEFGTLLLDPVEIIIKDGVGDGATDGTDTFAGNNSGQVGQILDNTNVIDTAPTMIFESELEGLSGDTNIILEASNNIIIEDLSDNALNFQPGGGSIIFRINTDAFQVGSFEMSPDDTIIAPGRDLIIERIGNNLEMSGCRESSANCQIILGNIDTSFPSGGGSVRITAQGNTEDIFPNIEVGTINTSSSNGLGGEITIETLATNGEIAGTVTIADIPFNLNNFDQFTQEILNTQGVNEAALININGIELDFNPTPPPPIQPPSPPVTQPPSPPVTQPPSSSVTQPPSSSVTQPQTTPPPIQPQTTPPPIQPQTLPFTVLQVSPLEEVSPETIAITRNLNNSYTVSNQVNNNSLEGTTSTGTQDTDVTTFNKVEGNFTTDFVNYLGIEPVPDVTLQEIQGQLQQAQQVTNLKPGLIYIFFQSPEQSLWEFSSQDKRSPDETSPQDSLGLMLVTASGKIVRQSLTNVTRQQVLSTVSEFQQTVTNPRRPSAYRQPAQQLYQWFIQPLEDDLQAAEIDTLVFLVEGGLRSVPMAALYDGSQFLIERYNMGIMPSFALTDTRYEDMTKQKVLAMGASEFNELNPLPAVPLELSVIADRLWQGNAFLNQKFTLNNLKQAHQSGEFGIIHLATHANFEPGKLGNSYIQLWQSRLSLEQLKKLDFGDPQVQLLVLSACRTALGDKEAELGFAGAAVLASVKTVLGSLWEVNDQGTLGLMTSFYEQLQKVPLKAKAIREAQLSLLRGEVYIKNGELVTQNNRLPLLSPLNKIEDESFTHPYFWSAFTLIGSPW